MPPPERAVGLMAGCGMRIWTVFQEPHPLRAVHGRMAGTFPSSAGNAQAFQASDLETARWIPSMPGADTEVYGGGPRTTRPPLAPDGVLNLPQEGRSVLARKVRY